MRKLFILLNIIAGVFSISAQAQNPDPSYRFVTAESFVQSKNYYLLTLLQQIPAAKQMIASDPVLSSIAKSKFSFLENAVTDKKTTYLDYSSGMKFSETEIADIGNRLHEIYTANNALGKIVKDHLIPSGTYILFKNINEKELLRKAWEQDAKAVNHAIEVYIEGKKPNYPAIDSIGFKRTAKSFNQLVYDGADVVRQEAKDKELFFGPSMHFALQFLELNERDEASDFEPMAKTVNKAAYDKVKSIDWKKFKYTVILIPGSGPDTYSRALSEGSILRCRIAALRYREGLAPFIVVSGGRVHPYKTKNSEAHEMKKFLMQTLHIPEEAIIMDPHARHTTTNIRNAVRLIFRYGMPINKTCLISTVRSQSYYITDPAFEKRCMNEINHIPYTLEKRLSESDFEFTPVLDALHIDADEPLDP